ELRVRRGAVHDAPVAEVEHGVVPGAADGAAAVVAALDLALLERPAGVGAHGPDGVDPLTVAVEENGVALHLDARRRALREVGLGEGGLPAVPLRRLRPMVYPHLVAVDEVAAEVGAEAGGGDA